MNDGTTPSAPATDPLDDILGDIPPTTPPPVARSDSPVSAPPASGRTPGPSPSSPAETSEPSEPATPPKRPTLFDLEAAYLGILAELDEGGEVSDERLESLSIALAEVDDAFDRKIEGWGRWIRQLEADATAPKAESQRLQKRGLGYERFADRLRRKLKDVLVRCDKTRVKTPLMTVTLKTGRAAVASVNLAELPCRFLVPPPPPPKPAADEDKILAEFRRTGVVPAGVTIVVSEWDENAKGPPPAGIVVDPARKVLEIR